MKKFISLLTSSALLTAVSASSAFAAENGTDYELRLFEAYGSVYNITVTNPDGTTYDPAENKNENMPDNAFYIDHAAEICIDELAYYEDYHSKFYSATFNTGNRKTSVQNGFPGQVVINDNELTLKNSSSAPDETDYIIQIYSGDKQWVFSGDIGFNNDVRVTFTNNGFILNGNPDNSIKVDMSTKVTEDSSEIYTAINVTSENFMVSLDENDAVVFSIDPDKDGVYEAVKKGDANFDGYVNASDASAILRLYSIASTEGTTEVNNYIADYNGDGVINADDATGVLKNYAITSTTN